jgi:hypothetical protein
MQMGYDFDDGRKGPPPLGRIAQEGQLWLPRGETHGDARLLTCPDWRELQARFLAQHALRNALAVQAAAQSPAGSFLLAGGPVLADCRNHASVNHTCSANGKGTSAITDVVAVSPTPGDRGPQ